MPGDEPVSVVPKTLYMPVQSPNEFKSNLPEPRPPPPKFPSPDIFSKIEEKRDKIFERRIDQCSVCV